MASCSELLRCTIGLVLAFVAFPLLADSARAQGKPKLEIVPQIGHSGSVLLVAFSPDGALVLSGSHDDTLKLWDAATGALLRTFESKGTTSIAFSPDGTRILSSGFETVKLWDAITGSLLRTFDGHSGWVLSVTFSPDGTRVLSGGYDTLKLWDATTGTTLRAFERATSPVAFSPDGARVVSGSDDNTLKLWDAATGALLRAFKEDAGLVSILARWGPRALG